MFSKFKKLLAYGTAVIIGLPSLAMASSDYHYTGHWEGLGLGYNPFTETLSMDYTHNRNAQRDDINSYWLVVTDGPMPMNGLSVQLIADMDRNTLTAYTYDAAYNKANNISSADNYEKGGQYLHTYHVDDLENGFEIDASIVNNAIADLDENAHLIGIDEENNKVGVWMKGGEGTPIYNDDGSIAEWSTGDGNYHIYDKHGLDVQRHHSHGVPEPAALLVMLSAAGFMRFRKKKNT